MILKRLQIKEIAESDYKLKEIAKSNCKKQLQKEIANRGRRGASQKAMLGIEGWYPIWSKDNIIF